MATRMIRFTFYALALVAANVHAAFIYHTSDGQVSTVNTTTTPLGSGATFTGTWEQNNRNDVMVSCQTDNGGTLYFEFSPDGTNVNTFPVNGFKVDAGIHEFHTAVKGPRYFRIRLVNDTGAQTYLRLYTYFGPNFKQGNLPINAMIGTDADARIVRSIDSGVDLAFGRIAGMREDEKFGNVRLIDAPDCPVTVWAYGSDDVNPGADKTFPTTAQDLFISSDSASDTNVDVEVHYIDSPGAGQTTTINLNGQTPVDLGDNGFDVNRALVTGATGLVGNVYINTENAHTGGVPNDTTTTLAYLRSTLQQTQLATYTVPLGKRIRIKYFDISMSRASGAAGSAIVNMKTRKLGDTWIGKRVFDPTNSSPIEREAFGQIYDERTSIQFEVESVSDSDTHVAVTWAYDEVDN